MGARRRQPDLLLIALPICVAVAALGLGMPGALEAWARILTGTAFRALDWFFLASVTGFVAISLWLGFGRYGQIRLGAADDEPEFSTLSWLSMLFAAGMGVGLLFWGVAEPVHHYTDAPHTGADTREAVRQAMVLTEFHWGLHAWGVYCFSGLSLAYFGFRRGAPHLAGTPIRQAFSGAWVAPVAVIADLVAVLAVAFGVAGSTGTGVLQMQAGLHVLAGLPEPSTALALGLLAVLAVCYMASAATGIGRGIKWLSNVNIALAILLLVFLLMAGPTVFLLREFFSTLGEYLSSLPRLSLQLLPEGAGRDWQGAWTLTNFLWWVSWAPFVGVFIARVSRGRTIRAFVTAVLLVPSTFSLLWFVVFGGSALHDELFGSGGLVGLVREDITAALFSLFDRLPGSALLGLLAIALVFIFLVTSLDSATFVLGMLTSAGSSPEPPLSRKLLWGVTVAALAAALLLSGNVRAIRAVAITGAFPFLLILLLQVVGLVRGLREEPATAPVATRRAPEQP